MNALEKWEVAPLTAQDRTILLEHLGFAGFEFYYGERSGGLLLRKWHFHDGQAHVPFPDESFPTDGAFLLREHPATQIGERPLFPAVPLSQELLPFPFQLWAQPEGTEAAGLLQRGPETWAQASGELRRAFELLEARLHRAEITVLEIGTGPQALVLFFHCVRKRFLKIGKMLGAEAGSVEASDLDSLGASYQILWLDVPRMSTFESQCSMVLHTVQSTPATESPHLAPLAAPEQGRDLPV